MFYSFVFLYKLFYVILLHNFNIHFKACEEYLLSVIIALAKYVYVHFENFRFMGVEIFK
jgi:hypothetical protein